MPPSRSDLIPLLLSSRHATVPRDVIELTERGASIRSRSPRSRAPRSKAAV